MRYVRETLRLKAAGASNRMIAGCLGIARSTVAEVVAPAAAAGLSWPLPEEMTDAALAAAIFKRPQQSQLWACASARARFFAARREELIGEVHPGPLVRRDLEMRRHLLPTLAVPALIRRTLPAPDFHRAVDEGLLHFGADLEPNVFAALFAQHIGPDVVEEFAASQIRGTPRLLAFVTAT